MKISKEKQSMLSASYLRSQLSYEPNTGVFIRILSNANNTKVGDVAGCVKTDGYLHIVITISGKQYSFGAHRLAWLYVYGVWPKAQLDHIDRDKLNNRIDNLREATCSENGRNRTKQNNTSSRYIGVCWYKNGKKWGAYIKHQGNRYYLGSYDTEKEAAIAYNKAALARDPKFYSLNNIIT
jgi:HNH endonuclease/AP2 domain